MKNYDEVLELRPSLIGTISVIGATAVGIPVDCLGFRDVLAVLTAGAVQGSAGAGVNLAVKIQESASVAGTGALWTDIDNGDVNGTFAFTTLNIGHGVNAGTWIPYQTGKLYESVGGNDANRKRYIRAHATLSGTVGLGPKVSVAFLLGKPVDTLYVGGGTSFGSLNSQLTKLL